MERWPWRRLSEGAALAKLLARADQASVRGVRDAVLPEWGDEPYAELEPADAAAQQEAVAAREAARADAHRRRVEETRRRAEEERKAKYRPTWTRFRDAATLSAADPVCVFVFEQGTAAAARERRCQYARKPDSPFCSQCRLMVDLLASEAAASAEAEAEADADDAAPAGKRHKAA